MAKEKISIEDKVWGAVSYLWILSLVALAARKDNDFVRFHASQGILLFIISLVMMVIPVVGVIINIIIAIFCIVAIIKSLKGEKWSMPVIGGAAKGFGDWVVRTLKL